MGMQEIVYRLLLFFFFSSRRRHTRLQGDWSSDVCSSDLGSSLPMGDLPYVLGTDGRSGNYYITNRNYYNRTQGFANLFLRPWKLAGTHQFTVGGRADRVIYHAKIDRGPIQFLDGNSNLVREITFSQT